jgi:LysR family transcriptional regulator, carnitine catabolism transcriptional activator
MLGISNLRVLIAVAETGGIRQAAKRLNRTPSAISMSLKQLEETIGTPLFEGDRKAHPTKFGLSTIEAALDLIKHYDNVCASIMAASRDEISRCTVASVTSFAATILPEAIRVVKKRSKNFEVMLREIHSVRMPDAVADGLVDVAFGRVGTMRSDVQATPLLSDRYSVVCRSDNPLAALGRPIRWDEFAAHDFVSFDSYTTHECEALAELSATARFYVSNASSAFALVSAGIGIAVLPQMARMVAPQGLRFLDIDDPTAHRIVGIIVRRSKKLSPATQMLIEASRALVSSSAGDLRIDTKFGP